MAQVAVPAAAAAAAAVQVRVAQRAVPVTAGGAGAGGTGGRGGSGGGSAGSGGGGSAGAGGSTSTSDLPGDMAKAAGTPFVAAHAMTRALFASYKGPHFKALRVSDQKEQDIGVVAAGGLVDTAALDSFCSGTSCKVTTLYDQSGNGNDMWRGDVDWNRPSDKAGELAKACDLLDIEYWQMSDGTKVPIALEHGWETPGAMWKDKGQCLRNREKPKTCPPGPSPRPRTRSSTAST